MHAPAHTKIAVPPAWLQATVSACLKLPFNEIDVHVPLTRYGMDSLAAVEITAAVADALGREVPESLLLDYPDVASLETYIAGQNTGAGTSANKTDSSASLLKKMLADSVLPIDIQPAPAKSCQHPQSILLTGATGFLGTHLLHALLHDTDATIYCLIRPGKYTNGTCRIRDSLMSHDLWDPTLASRIHTVNGDVGCAQLGLADEMFAELCEKIDIIYHCAASVNWVLSYEALRNNNVLANLELLRLACRYKRKSFHFVSSVGVCYSTVGPRTVTEQTDMLSYLSGIHLGYAQSKCVAEALAQQASARGLPVTIYRPALLCGNSRSGKSNVNDFLSLLIKGCIEMRSAPDINWALDCIPVNFLAEAIVKLSRDTGNAFNVFHLTNPGPRDWREAVLWMNLFGYSLQLLPYDRWLEQLKAESGPSTHPLHRLQPFFLQRPPGAGGLTLPELYEDHRRSRLTFKATCEALDGVSLTCPPLEAQLLDRYFKSFVDVGFLPAIVNVPNPAKRGTPNSFDKSFFARVLRNACKEPMDICKVTRLDGGSNHSVITELSSWKYGRATGLSRFAIRTTASSGARTRELQLVVKVKASDEEVIEVGERIAALCNETLGRAFRHFKRRIGLTGCHKREIALYRLEDIRLRRHTPSVYGIIDDDANCNWALVLENIESSSILLDTADDVSGWHREHIEAAIRGITEVHSIWYGREAELRAQPWLGPTFSAGEMAEMKELWVALYNHADRYFADQLGREWRGSQQELIDGVGDWWAGFEAMPRTLIHNDFNPRNVALRKTPDLRLCAYDWELATLGVPQHDLAEMLCFVLPARVDKQEVFHYLDTHRLALQRATGRPLDPYAWRHGFALSLYDLIINRFPMYAMVHTFRPQKFLQRILGTWRSLYEIFPYGEEHKK